MDSFKNNEGKSIVLGMLQAVQQNKEYLSEVDGAIGDGDHGANMNKGFTMSGKRIEQAEYSFTGALDELGDVLFSEIGGSMGPIYGTLFMDMAESADGEELIDTEVFSRMLLSATEGLKELVDARVGDKTLMDVLIPAGQAFAAAKGQPFKAALDAMVDAAEKGKESTRDMVAKFGRASRLGERSRGVLDAGAVSCALILQAMAQGIQALL